MPEASIDTFFACALMVLLVLFAMASTTKTLYPHTEYAAGINLRERYEEISKYLLLNAGEPAEWGSGNQTAETFGLAKAESDISYDLDIDKVSRMNSDNLFSVSYADLFSKLGMSDLTFRLEITPVFEVNISLGATYVEDSQTTYGFEVLAGMHGSSVDAVLQTYVVAEGYMESEGPRATDGRASLNVTLPNSVQGPALLVVLAKSAYADKVLSFGLYRFQHGVASPEASGAFATLSPLNQTVTAMLTRSNLTLLDAYAFTFSHDSMMTLVTNSSQAATYSIPRFVDSSPVILVLTGRNSTAFFAEYVAYPHVPVEMGADFTNHAARSDVFAFTYAVTVDSAVYECTVWLGGPRE